MLGLMDVLRTAIDEAGGAATLARKCGITAQAISQWKGRIPADRVLDISRACSWRVTPHKLRPDLYPHPDDGLPSELRNGARRAA